MSTAPELAAYADFTALVERLRTLVAPGEEFLSTFAGEHSDFVRFNHSRVRQAGSIKQQSLTVDLIEGRRHAAGSTSLSGEPTEDRDRLERLVLKLRSTRSRLAEDPHLHYDTDPRETFEVQPGELPDSGEAIDQIATAATGLDLVGIWASGPVNRGFASSFGHRSWHSAMSFNFDWSLYHLRDKAVKGNYAGTEWSAERFRAKLAAAEEQLEMLRRTPRTLEPGVYRAALAPSALREILGLTGWGGYGLRSHRTGQTPLIKLARGECALHPSVTITENHALAPVPRFTACGFLKDERIPLVVDGHFAQCLVDARSACEYGQRVNDESEQPEALEMQPGDIPSAELLRRLDTGLLVNDLWYLNFSGWSDCRMTGMTRFASFWVQDGRIEAPINAMRFDDSLYRMLGSELVGLTVERELMLETDTYEQRSMNSSRVPGALIAALELTL